MLDFGFYNMDCLEEMKEFPDNYFDLAIVDPPYGDGGGTGSVKMGADLEETLIDTSRSVCRTGGTWAKKYTKKSLRGILPQEKNTLKSYSVSHAIKLFGAEIILNYHRQDALLSGRS